jgi:AcrR family transcriptional regulator
MAFVLGLRERKKLATREALGRAALRLAVERGMDNVLVEDIAAAAAVSPRTFNNYFASKQEAICAPAMDRAHRIGDALRSRPDGESLWAAIMHAVSAEYENPIVPEAEWRAGIRLVTGAPQLQGEYLKVRVALQYALVRFIAARTGRDLDADLYPHVLAGAVAAALDVATGRWIHADPPASPLPLFRDALRQLTLIPGEFPTDIADEHTLAVPGATVCYRSAAADRCC